MRAIADDSLRGLPKCLADLHPDLTRAVLAPLNLRIDADQAAQWHRRSDPHGGLDFAGAPLSDPSNFDDALRPSDFFGSQRHVDARLVAFCAKWDTKLSSASSSTSSAQPPTGGRPRTWLTSS